MEAQLQQASKMESIGQLAGGVAHDINNMLAPIIGYAEMLTAEPEEGEDRRKYAQQIIIAAARVEAIVRQLLAFSRKRPAEERRSLFVVTMPAISICCLRM